MRTEPKPKTAAIPNDNILQIDIPSVIRHILPHLICLPAPLWAFSITAGVGTYLPRLLVPAAGTAFILFMPVPAGLDDLAASAVRFPPAAAVLLSVVGLFGLMRLLLWPFKLLALVVITLITMLPVGFSVGGTLSSLNYIFPGRHFYQA